MAEPVTAFVAARQAEWAALEALLAGGPQTLRSLADVERLDALYRRVSADLARASAVYPSSDVHAHLNQLCGAAYRALYRPVSAPGAAARRFFAEELPRTARQEARFLAASGALFLLSVALGASVTWLEPRGAELLVPEALRRSIAQREMWTDNLLSVLPPSLVSSAILTNNLGVAISLFALGLLAGLGTVLVLVHNGLHLGSVGALCLHEGMGRPFFDFVSAHGPVELSVFVVAGGAGLMVGQALIDPGELPRGQRLRTRAATAVRLLLGVAPALALIGAVEGFVSPGSLFPTWAKATLGLGLGGAFWGYLALAGRR